MICYDVYYHNVIYKAPGRQALDVQATVFHLLPFDDAKENDFF